MTDTSGILARTALWAQATEAAIGANDGLGRADVINRPLRNILRSSGWSPDATTFSGLPGPVYNVCAYGAKGDGTTDDTAAIQAAVTAAGSGAKVYFPGLAAAPRSYKFTSTIQVSVKGLSFCGSGFTQTGLQYSGTGAAIQLGTDDGLDWDAGNYNGVADGFAFEGMSLDYTGTKTPLSNGLGTGYGSGTYGIRDWRGGSVRLTRAKFGNWDYCFWGVQSDINYFQDLILQQNHSGIYLGPRSDQCGMDHIWTFNNDQVFWFQGSNGHHITHWITDGDGSATINPCKITASTHAQNARFATTRICEDITFEKPWLECFDGSSAFDVEAFIEVGVADTVQSGIVVLNNPLVAVNPYNTPGVPHTKYLVKADNATAVVIRGVTGITTVPWSNLRSLIEVVNAGASTNVPYVFFEDYTISNARFIENYSVSTVSAHMNVDGNANYTNNVIGGTGNVFMGRLSLQRFFGHSNAAVGSTNGDTTLNRLWQNNGAPFMWMNTGSVAAPFIRNSMSADRGDASITATVATDHPIQLFNTALTTARTVTLAGGTANGDTFTVVRTASATGAFNLSVIGGTTKVLNAAGQWCTFVYQGGGGWVEVAAGSL